MKIMNDFSDEHYNNKFWEELICLPFLHNLTLNNLFAMFTM